MIDFSKQYSWEIACVIFEMIEGKFPFPFPVPEGAEPFEFTNSTVKCEFRDLVRKMLKYNATKRISIENAWEQFANCPFN